VPKRLAAIFFSSVPARQALPMCREVPKCHVCFECPRQRLCVWSCPTALVLPCLQPPRAGLPVLHVLVWAVVGGRCVWRWCVGCAACLCVWWGQNGSPNHCSVGFLRRPGAMKVMGGHQSLARQPMPTSVYPFAQQSGPCKQQPRG